MKEVYLSWSDIYGQTHEILRQIQIDGWQPDYVVGITRGGLVPACLISQYLDVRMETLKVSLRNDGECESNLWMAEDAFGYVMKNDLPAEGEARIDCDPALKKNILIVDDINDSGATINWIKQDWQTSCLPNDSTWNNVWEQNVRFATLVDNQSSENEIPVTYSAMMVNKLEDPQWIIFPWEEWWRR